MPDLLHNLALGFGVALSPMNVFLCLIGVTIGTLTGVLGVGLLAPLAVLAPITYAVTPVGGLIMLAGVYYGAQYGSGTASILGSPNGAAAITNLDGRQLAAQGRAGRALAIAAIGAFFASCVSTVLVAALAPLTSIPFKSIALLFGPAEYFSLLTLILCIAIVLARGPLLKAAATVMLGVLLSRVGSDVETGQSRMAFDIPELADGFGFFTVAMGVLVFAAIMRRLEQSDTRQIVDAKPTGPMLAWPDLPDLKSSAGAIGRGTALGSILGILPGGSAIIASVAAYAFEKKVSRHPERFGHGAMEGVASPASAGTAAAQASIIWLLTFIAPNMVVGLMAPALTLHGIVPGQEVMTRQPDLFWGLIASMWIGNLMLIVINLPMTGTWVTLKLLQVPYRFIFPVMLIFCLITVYSINSAPIDCIIMAVFGLIAYGLARHAFEPVLMLLGFEVGRLMEETLRRAILVARGDPATFLTRPISAGLLAVALALLIVAMLPVVARKRDKVFAADPEGTRFPL